MIYRLPPVAEPVDQGDLVENCPVAFVAGFHPAHWMPSRSAARCGV